MGVSDEDWNRLKKKEYLGMITSLNARVSTLKYDMLEFMEQTQEELRSLEKRLDSVESKINMIMRER